ncbi:MAG TPA: M48 family metalloprotease [Candidatus Omnitrophota bacterium]|nr:M48 family metalloprotease [Candidatus Omnitrophota bacterium]
MMRALRYLNFFLAVFMCAVFSGCATYYNPATQKNEAAWLSLEQEDSIAINTLRAKLQGKVLVKDARALETARALASPIGSPRIRDKHIIVYEDKEIQAFTPGGGYIVVSTGLLAAATDDELAAVIAHEMGHDEARHVMKMVEKGLGAEMALNLAYLLDTRPADKKDQAWQYFSQAANVVYTLAANGFSRQDEYAADRLSIKYMYQAGYDPNAIVTFLEKLQRLGGDAKWVYFLRSHPYLYERIAAAKEEINKYPAEGSREGITYKVSG